MPVPWLYGFASIWTSEDTPQLSIVVKAGGAPIPRVPAEVDERMIVMHG